MTSLKGWRVFITSTVFVVFFVLAVSLVTGFASEKSFSKQASFGDVFLVEDKGMVFVGDIMLARSVERNLLSLPKEHAFLEVKELFKDKFVVGNFEASVPKVHEPTPNFTFKFSVTPQLLPILKEAGIEYLSLANNHALDFGVDGYRNTLEQLKNQDLIPFGHPSAVSSSSVSYIDLGNKKVAVIGISNLFTNPSKAEWEPFLEEAKKKSDLQIVYIHWGNEYELVHNETQSKLAKELIDAGVEIIVGHHPHVVQDIWRYQNGLVFYSLGNFLFDQYWEDAVLEGLALDFSVTSEDEWQVKLVPVESKSVRLQPREMVDREREIFLTELALRSDPSLVESIRKGIISLQF